MAIQYLDLDSPNTGDGTPLRDGGQIINDNFTDPENMASKLAQTSPTDATAGRGLINGSWGWGTDSRVLTNDLDTTLVSGLYGFSVGANGNPTSLEGSLLVFPRSNASGGVRYIQQIFMQDGSQFSRTNNGGTWSAWKRIDPQGFGLGVNTGINSSADLDTYLTSGQYSVQSASPNNPTGNAILTVGVRNDTNITQFLESTISSLGIWTRTRSAGTWSAWQPVYTGANLKPNVFEANAVGDSPINGSTADTTKEISFIVPTLFPVAATDIDVVGQWDIALNNGVVVSSDITVLLSSRSGIGGAKLFVTDAVGLTVGTSYRLQAGSSNSKVELLVI